MLRRQVREVPGHESMAELIDEITTELAEPGSDRATNGERAELYFVSGDNAAEANPWLPSPSGTQEPDHCLYVSVNRTTGYGGLIWFCTADRPETETSPQGIWVSDSPEPPADDPRVPADPYNGIFHDAASAIPVKHVVAALEEFFTVGNGDRPTTVQWVAGDMQGRRS
ncbi:Imm1 family immunity protein [Promicromonospora sp. NPDC057138]|uniref:Imm1 family immunity protein n=1 Tax=Promicromonospora sp. NPDC057138 TaxID=3346031 RepID=UPI00363DF603